MRRLTKTSQALLLAALAAGALAGCNGMSMSVPFDRDIVWRAAAAEAVAWRPTRIDIDKYYVECIRSNSAGTAIKYELRVRPDPWSIPYGSRTRVTVKMRQTNPTQRFDRLEREFLAQVKAKLESISAARR